MGCVAVPVLLVLVLVGAVVVGRVAGAVVEGRSASVTELHCESPSMSLYEDERETPFGITSDPPPLFTIEAMTFTGDTMPLHSGYNWS